MTSSTRRGFTLIEVLVAATLGLLLLGMVFEFLIPTVRAQTRGSARVELEQMAVVALNRIAADLDNTAAAGLSVATSPASLGIVRIAGVTSSGTQQWETAMVIYSLQGGRLIRKVCPPPGTTSPVLNFSGTAPLQVSATVLGSLAADPNGTEAVVASNVTSFSVQTGGTPAAPANPVTLTIALSRSVGDWNASTHADQPIGFGLTRTVTMNQAI